MSRAAPAFKNKVPENLSTPVVVVVEDNPSDQLLIRLVLENAGYHVLLGYYGKRGLELLDFCRDNKLNLVAIISDILMPMMDGMQFLQEVRRRPDNRRTPFLFLTAVNDSFMWDAEKYGANGFLTKPVSPEDLLAKVKEVIHKQVKTSKLKSAAA